MRRVCVVKTRRKKMLLLILPLLHVASRMTCDDDTTAMKRWALLSLPDEFDVADAKWTLHVCWHQGEPGGGCLEGEMGEQKWADSSCNWGHGFFFDNAMHNS
jgi:hypothetical protein